MPTPRKALNNILAIDSSGSELGLGINGTYRAWTQDQHYSEILLSEVAKMLDSAGVKPQGLKGVNFVSGPGSFTGLRIGATIANGIGFAEGVAIRGVSKFEVIRNLVGKVDVVILDAGRGELFVEKAGKSQLLPLNKLASLVKAGDRVYVDTPQLAAAIHPGLKKAGTIFFGPIKTEDGVRALTAMEPGKKYRQTLPLYIREANITKSSKVKTRPRT